MKVNPNQIREGIDFILSHFEGQHELFPRTIMAAKLGRQMKIEYESDEQKSKDKIFEYFRQSDFVDCRINAFPYNTEYTINCDIKNKTAPTFIMIDFDLENFNGDKVKLDKHLKKTIKQMSKVFHHESFPTILWTGRGYHIYQPIEPIEGRVLEEYEEFHKFLPYLNNRDLTTECLKFSEKYFTNGKSDSNHNPSIKSCLVRVPGTINSKNNSIVEVIQSWDGEKSPIQFLTKEFHLHLIQKRIDKINEDRRIQTRKKLINPKFHEKNKIEWIENLLNTPIEDYRKYCLWQILIPYLVNVKYLQHEQITTIVEDWLSKCDRSIRLNFNSKIMIKKDLKSVKKYLPISQQKLRKNYIEIYRMFQNKNIF